MHLVTARDALLLRPLMQRVIERVHNGAFGRRMGGADPRERAAAVRELLDDRPLPARELGGAWSKGSCVHWSIADFRPDGSRPSDVSGEAGRPREDWAGRVATALQRGDLEV